MITNKKYKSNSYREKQLSKTNQILMNNKELKLDKEESIIYEILQQLDGLDIALAHDTLHKVQLILSLTETPINSARIRTVWFPEFCSQREQATKYKDIKLLIQNNKEYHSVAMTSHLELYLWVDLWYAKLMPCTCLYYKIPSEVISKVKKITRANLLNDFAGTPFEQKLVDFLRRYHPCKKDRKTGAYKILEVFASN